MSNFETRKNRTKKAGSNRGQQTAGIFGDDLHRASKAKIFLKINKKKIRKRKSKKSQPRKNRKIIEKKY